MLLMITDGKKWHYLAVKSLSTLLRGIKSKHDGDFYCLNCFHLYSTKKQQQTNKKNNSNNNNNLKNEKKFVMAMIIVM